MSDLIRRSDVLDLVEKGILVSNGNYKSVCDAINGLPSVEPESKLEKCNDCISRKAATDRFDLVQSDDKCMGYDDIMQFLLSLPSVEPEIKTGKWIVEKDCEGKTRTCTCNLCGYETGEYTWVNPNYCENCGAKMEELKNEKNTDTV